MSRRILFAVFACALGAARLSAATLNIGPGDFLPGATVVGFETGSTSLPIIASATIVDDFGSSPPFLAAGAFVSDFFGAQVMTNVSFGQYSDIAITFNSPVQGAGAWVGKIENLAQAIPESLEVRVLNAGGDELKLSDVMLPFPQRGDDPLFVGFWSDEGISRIEWRVGNAGYFGVDNLMFGAAVPEPVCGLLLALLGVMGSQRRSVTTAKRRL